MRWHTLSVRLDRPETKALSKLARALADMEEQVDYEPMLDADDVFDLIERLAEIPVREVACG